MSFLPKTRSSSNRKLEPIALDKHSERRDIPAYEQPRLITGGSEGRVSRDFKEAPYMFPYQSASLTSNRVDSTPSTIHPANDSYKSPIKTTPSSGGANGRFSSRSEPSLVASSSSIHQPHRSASNSERHKLEPPIPLPPRSATIPAFDNKFAISRMHSNSTAKLEPGSHNKPLLPYVPDYPRAACQQVSPSRSTKQYPSRRPRTSSGTASEDRALAFVDMKRLLSKPALPSNAMTIVQSPPLPQSNSEFSPSGSHNVTSQASPAKSRQTLDRVPSTKRGESLRYQGKSSPIAISPVRVTRMSSQPQLSSSPEELLPSYRSFPSSPQERKQLPMLKRRPSGPRSPALSSPIKLVPVTKLAGSSSHQTVSCLTIDPALSRRPTGRRMEASQSTSSSPLTPAGAVAEAYKQQEHKRDYLSRQASGSDEKETSRNVEWPFPDENKNYISPNCPGVAGGSREKSTDGSMVDSHPISNLGAGQGAKQKVSARWKKAPSGVRGDEFTSSHIDSTPGVHGRRSTSLPREKTKPLGRSLDMRLPDTHLPGESISSMFPTKARTSIAIEDDVRQKTGKLVKARGDRGEKDEDGNKIWRLVKRISTGALRDKYQMGNPPPVPPLPNKPISNGDCAGILPPPIKPQSIIPRGLSPTTSPRASPGSRNELRSVSGSRPSMITASSSSPGSSGFASTQSFHFSHSAKSSSSSNYESAPPVPTTMIGQHIIPPSELYRMNMEHEAGIKPPISKSHAPQRSISLPVHDSLPPPDYWPEYTRPSLPHPPRRVAAPKKQGTHQRDKSSPELDFSSTEDADKLLKTQNNPHDTTSRIPKSSLALSPGLRPAPSTNLRRQRLCSLSVSTQSSNPSPSTTKAQTPLPNDSHNDFYGGNLKPSSSVNSTSTVLLTSPTSKDISTTPKSPERSPLNFRELGNPSHAILTAKEKADIWNDLLERSDRAGGTLHIGGQELMSEQMRLSPSLSNYTEITDIP